MAPNFAACGSNFLNHSADLYSEYIYHGPIDGLLSTAARPVLMTLQGCKALCGTGISYYSWKDASNTITTWVNLDFDQSDMPRLTKWSAGASHYRSATASAVRE